MAITISKKDMFAGEVGYWVKAGDRIIGAFSKKVGSATWQAVAMVGMTPKFLAAVADEDAAIVAIINFANQMPHPTRGMLAHVYEWLK